MYSDGTEESCGSIKETLEAPFLKSVFQKHLSLKRINISYFEVYFLQNVMFDYETHFRPLRTHLQIK